MINGYNHLIKKLKQKSCSSFHGNAFSTLPGNAANSAEAEWRKRRYGKRMRKEKEDSGSLIEKNFHPSSKYTSVVKSE